MDLGESSLADSIVSTWIDPLDTRKLASTSRIGVSRDFSHRRGFFGGREENGRIEFPAAYHVRERGGGLKRKSGSRRKIGVWKEGPSSNREGESLEGDRRSENS